jgi:hypothetical protein
MLRKGMSADPREPANPVSIHDLLTLYYLLSLSWAQIMGKITGLFETLKPKEVYHTHSTEDGVPPLTFVVSIQQCQCPKNQEPINGGAETDNTTQDTIVAKEEPFDRQDHTFNPVDYPELPESFSWRKKWLITLLGESTTKMPSNLLRPNFLQESAKF